MLFRSFKFDVLKIDRSFIMGLPENQDDVQLVKAILAMAKGLDLRVVAEGVENREQLSFVTTHGCDLTQGYLLAKPMSEDSYVKFLRSLNKGLTPLKIPVA